MHLAVRSGNPQMVTLLGDILHNQVLNLLEGPFALNAVQWHSFMALIVACFSLQEKDVPYTLALKLRLYGTVDALKNLFNAYYGQQAPPIPEKPIPPDLPSIDLIQEVPDIASPLSAQLEDRGAASYVPGWVAKPQPMASQGAPEVGGTLRSISSHRGEPPMFAQPPDRVVGSQVQQPHSGIVWDQPQYQMDRLSGSMNSRSLMMTVILLVEMVFVIDF